MQSTTTSIIYSWLDPFLFLVAWLTTFLQWYKKLCLWRVLFYELHLLLSSSVVIHPIQTHLCLQCGDVLDVFTQEHFPPSLPHHALFSELELLYSSSRSLATMLSSSELSESSLPPLEEQDLWWMKRRLHTQARVTQLSRVIFLHT